MKMQNFEPTGVEERVRILEARYTLMRDRIFLINQNMIQEYRKLSKEIKMIDSEFKSVKQDLNEIKGILRNVVNEMQGFAKKENVKVLEKYVDFWNPLNFVTEKEVMEIMNRGEKNSSQKTTNRQG
ncbi:MAG: hypothetical protein AABW45_03565 [Nanoarchaeota archaeon]